jgi:hypothetical protein
MTSYSRWRIASQHRRPAVSRGDYGIANSPYLWYTFLPRQ